MDTSDCPCTDAQRLIFLNEADRPSLLGEAIRAKDLRKVAALILDLTRPNLEKTSQRECPNFHYFDLFG